MAGGATGGVAPTNPLEQPQGYAARRVLLLNGAQTVCDCCRLSTSIYACTSDASLFRISVISRRPEAQRAGVCGLATWPVAFSILVSVT